MNPEKIFESAESLYAEEKYAEALDKYLQLKDLNIAAVWTMIGHCYWHSEQFEQAVFWYTKAAKQGDADAQTNLGLCYQGGAGVEKSYEEAFYWYRRAAEQRQGFAEYSLGILYEHGWGVGQSVEKAEYWYARGAEDGVEAAAENLEMLKK